jgi:hypothetical protein
MGESVRMRRALEGRGTWLRVDDVTSGQSGDWVVTMRVSWWTLQGFQIWLACARDVLELLELPLASPRALWHVVIDFPGWKDLKNFADRRLGALRKVVDGLFVGEHELKVSDVAQSIVRQIFFGPHDRGDLTGKVIAAKLLNGGYGQKTLSEDRARALVATKKPSAKRMILEKPPRPPQPMPRFSPEKFRGLIDKGIITQAEYDACFVPAAPRPTMTVEVPPEIEAAIVDTLLRSPSGS